MRTAEVGRLLQRFKRPRQVVPFRNRHACCRRHCQRSWASDSDLPAHGGGVAVRLCDKGPHQGYRPRDEEALLRQFREDIVVGKLQVFGLCETELTAAERLIGQYAFDLRLRAMDAIQMAVAVALRKQRLVDHFVAADKVLCEVAALEGFSVINPEIQ